MNPVIVGTKLDEKWAIKRSRYLNPRNLALLVLDADCGGFQKLPAKYI